MKNSENSELQSELSALMKKSCKIAKIMNVKKLYRIKNEYALNY